VNDIFMACVDELKGFPETIEAIYLHTEVQLCIVHLVRASLNYVPWKHRKLVAADLRRDLSCGHGGGSQAQSGGGNSEVERLSQRQPSVEWELGSHFPLSRKDSQGDLYHQLRRDTASLVAQDHQNTGSFSQRRCQR
jgi:hypothetical protein